MTSVPAGAIPCIASLLASHINSHLHTSCQQLLCTPLTLLVCVMSKPRGLTHANRTVRDSRGRLTHPLPAGRSSPTCHLAVLFKSGSMAPCLKIMDTGKYQSTDITDWCSRQGGLAAWLNLPASPAFNWVAGSSGWIYPFLCFYVALNLIGLNHESIMSEL